MAEAQDLTQLSRKELEARAAAVQAALAAKPRPGRKPAHPRLTIKDGGTIELIAERVVGLISNELLLAELDCTEAEMVTFLKRPGVLAKVRRTAAELRQSGEVGRKLANTKLVNGVRRAASIIEDPEVGPNTAIAAAGLLSKVGATNGKQKQLEEQGPRFSIVMNLGGEPLEIETEIEGEVIDNE